MTSLCCNFILDNISCFRYRWNCIMNLQSGLKWNKNLVLQHYKAHILGKNDWLNPDNRYSERLKELVIKWSGHSEMGTFRPTTEVAGKHKFIFKFIENYPKIWECVEVIQLYKTSGKMAKCYSLIRYFQFFNNFWRYVCCTSTCLFHTELASLAKKQPVCHHNITAHVTTWFIIIIIIHFLYLRYLKALFH